MINFTIPPDMQRLIAALIGLVVLAPAANAQSTAGTTPVTDSANDPVRIMVARLDLDQYKANVKGLTQFGDRRQGTDRNRKAVDWIEAQLKSYGCANTERITYDYQSPPPRTTGARGPGRGATTAAQGGGRIRGNRIRTGVNTDSLAQKDLKLRALN